VPSALWLMFKVLLNSTMPDDVILSDDVIASEYCVPLIVQYTVPVPYVVYPVLVRYTLTETVTLDVLFATLWLFCVIVILYLILSLVVDIADDVAISMPPTIS
jgi:hypothetical protein